MGNPAFMSCDWGTTSFRLRPVSSRDEIVLQELQEKAGVKSLHEQALNAGAKTEVERSRFFEEFLWERTNHLLQSIPNAQRPLPMVISGMVSSSVGWKELP